MRLFDFIQHRLRSHSRHGIHSPFVYRLIDECIYASQPKVNASIAKHFERLKTDDEILEGHDHGKGQDASRRVRDYARTSSIKDFQAELLHRFVSFSKPTRVLELGSNLGKSLSYMADAHAQGEFVGVEGHAGLARHASASLDTLGITNARIECSTFESYLDGDNGPFDLVFVDGDHHFEPTMRYLQTLKQKMGKEGCFIFHDIYWSEGMKRAWTEIKKDRDVVVTLDLFFMGFAWIGKDQAKEDFSIRFPLQLFRLLL